MEGWGYTPDRMGKGGGAERERGDGGREPAHLTAKL